MGTRCTYNEYLLFMSIPGISLSSLCTSLSSLLYLFIIPFVPLYYPSYLFIVPYDNNNPL